MGASGYGASGRRFVDGLPILKLSGQVTRSDISKFATSQTQYFRTDVY